MAAFSYIGGGGELLKGLLEAGETNSAHTMDAPHLSDSGLLHFQVRQCEQQLDGHLHLCGGFGQEV